MSKLERTYLRAKAVLLAMVLEPPLRFNNRANTYELELAHMDFQNARDELFDDLNAYH